MKMYELLRTGGRMAVICSSHWKIGSEKKCAEFREWLQNVGAEVLDVRGGFQRKRNRYKNYDDFNYQTLFRDIILNFSI